MNRSAKDGAWSSPHYGDEGAWVPLRRTKVCAGDTVAKNVSDSGRPGIVRRLGMAGIVRHSQTKGRATGNAKPSLKPANGRCGYKRKRNSGRCGARSRIGARYSRTGSEQKVPDRHHRAATLVGSKRPTGGGEKARQIVEDGVGPSADKGLYSVPAGRLQGCGPVGFDDRGKTPTRKVQKAKTG